MRSRSVLILAISSFALVSASTLRSEGDVVERGKYRLYKVEAPIGEETYEMRSDQNSLVLTDKFLFTDRGSAVPLETTFRGSADLTPITFATKGKTSRRSSIDTSVEINSGRAKIRQMKLAGESVAPMMFFTISGYSPMAQQMLMLRYWIGHGSPALLPIVPQGTDVQILSRGTEKVTVAGKQVTLTRYSVTGLIWGSEVLWLDSDRHLVAAVTTDAEFDHFEATAEGYESLLPKLVAEAAAVDMGMLSELSRGLRLNQVGPLAIVGATLVDGTGKPAVPDSVVVLEKGRIAAAGKRGSVPVPKGAIIFDGKGKTLLPGLWDMHAHFEQVEWGPIYLAAGVTTARDVGNELEFISTVRDAIRNGRGLGPQLLLAGIVDGSGPTTIGIERVDTPGDAARWVREYKKAGFQQMKIYSSVKLENVKAICDEAHKVGMTVTGHIPEGLDIYQGVGAGIDQVNHIQYVLAPLMATPPQGQKYTREQRIQAMALVDTNGPEAQKEIQFLKVHDTVIDPTIALMEMGFRSSSVPLSKLEPGVVKVAPELAEPLNNTGVDPDFAPTAEAAFEKALALVGALHKAGVRVVAGTDQAVPGHSLHHEIELYVQAGFTPMEAIQAATVVPAQVMGLDRQVGTVEVGKRADLILLDANPLEDIHNIRSVTYVVANGVLYPTAKLWESVGFRP